VTQASARKGKNMKSLLESGLSGNCLSEKYSSFLMREGMRLLVLFGLASGITIASASAATITVNTATDLGGAGVATNCAPGNTNTCRLRDAIVAANFVVGAAVGDDIVFSLPANSVITLQSALDVDRNLTVNGSGSSGLAVSGNDTVRVFFVTVGVTAAFSNLTIRNGSADFGGGIRNEGALTLTNCTVSGNVASGNGGGIVNHGPLVLNDSTVSGNTTAGRGGGIANGPGVTLLLNDSTVSGNFADFGGGIDNAGGDIALSNSAVTGNTGSSFGGGIGNGLGSLELYFSTVSGNTTPGNGGGIINNGTVVLDMSTVSGNTAGGFGGGVASGPGSLRLHRSTVSGNGANDGGGIDNYQGFLVLYNSTVSGNTASSNGGGVHNWGIAGVARGEAKLVHATLAGNGTTGDFYAAVDSDAAMTNTMAQSCVLIGGIQDNGGNLDGGTGCGFAAADSNAILGLGALVDNGGATWTMMPNAGSPAIGRGVAAGCTDAQVSGVDQRGVSRPAAACTSGAVEFAVTTPHSGASVPALDRWVLLLLAFALVGLAFRQRRRV
jgi:hypothetical protein